MIDLIGDIHGHADKLEALLLKLGYSKKQGAYSHPERKVLFVGDYIDRGPKIRETLQIIRAMVEDDHAIGLMGNHEYNALCFHFKDPDGGHLRKHSFKNIIQHCETIKQFKDLQSEYEDYLKWFMTLPLYYETEAFRAVHACWDKSSIDYLRQTLVNDRLNESLIYQSEKHDPALKASIEIILGGKEIKLPNGHFIIDKDGYERSEIRIKWWENPSEMTLKSICVEPHDKLPEKEIEDPELKTYSYYKSEDKNVFFGHYWLTGEPSLIKENVCCLDYSIANDGKLVAYQLDGENKLCQRNLIYV